MFWLQSGKDGCYVKSGLSLDGETGFSAIMHKKIIPVFSLFPCIKIHIASRLRDLQSYHFDKTTDSHDRITLREICPESESDIILCTEKNRKIAKEFMLCTH